MDNRKILDPQRRKPIHAKWVFDEMQDNAKNIAIMAQSRRRLNSQNNKDDDDDEIVSSDEDLDLILQERLLEERFSDHSGRLRRRQRVPEIRTTPPTTPIRTEKPKLNKNIEKSVPFRSQNLPNCNQNCWTSVIVVSVLLAAVTVACFANGCFKLKTGLEENVSKIHSTESVLSTVKETLFALKSKYKNQDKKLWKDTYISIMESIKKPNKPNILLLVGEESGPLDCLAMLLGNVSSNALNSNRLTLTPNKFDHNVGSVIEHLRKKIQEESYKTVVIWDLLNINIEALKAFHNLCDRVNPLAKEVIIIITVIVNNFDEEEDPYNFVEKELAKKLNGKMKKDAIDPLITRITDGPILAVRPEPNIIDCPLPKASKQ